LAQGVKNPGWKFGGRLGAEGIGKKGAKRKKRDGISQKESGRRREQKGLEGSRLRGHVRSGRTKGNNRKKNLLMHVPAGRGEMILMRGVEQAKHYKEGVKKRGTSMGLLRGEGISLEAIPRKMKKADEKAEKRDIYIRSTFGKEGGGT